MSLIDDHIKRIEEVEIPKLRKELKSLEDGSMNLAEHKADGEWNDKTQHWIAHLKEVIAMCEKMVAGHKKPD